MPFHDLQNAIQRAGFTVIEFQDARSYFGCWSLTVEGHAITCLIVNEGRDGWLMFYRRGPDGMFIEVDKKETARMDSTAMATQCLSWLCDHPVTGLAVETENAH